MIKLKDLHNKNTKDCYEWWDLNTSMFTWSGAILCIYFVSIKETNLITE
jgi:hypothetical protein